MCSQTKSKQAHCQTLKFSIYIFLGVLCEKKKLNPTLLCTYLSHPKFNDNFSFASNFDTLYSNSTWSGQEWWNATKHGKIMW